MLAEREIQGPTRFPPHMRQQRRGTLQVHSYDGGAFKSKGQYDIKSDPQVMVRMLPCQNGI